MINDVSDLTPAQRTQYPANPAYGTRAVNGLTIVGNSPPQNLGATTLDRTTRQVQVVVAYDSVEDLAGGTGTLSATGWTARTTATTSGGAPGATSKTFTFSNVPWGCWAFSLPFPNVPFGSAHTGTVSSTENTSSCRVSVPSPTDASPSSITSHYTFDEHKLVITPTITANSPTDVASTPTFTLTLTDSSSTVVYTTPFSTSSAITLYVPSDSYTVTVTRGSGVSADMWPTRPSWSRDVDLTSGSQTGVTVTATEAHLSTLNIPTYVSGQFHADATHVLTITLTCTAHQGVPAGCDGAPTTVTASDNGSVTPSSLQLAPGAWDLDISGTAAGSGASTKVLNDPTQHLTLTAGGTQTVSW